MPLTLTKYDREELAVALILWKDFKCNGKFDVEISKQCLEYAEHLGVKQELDSLLPRIPQMRIVERFPTK